MFFFFSSFFRRPSLSSFFSSSPSPSQDGLLRRLAGALLSFLSLLSSSSSSSCPLPRAFVSFLSPFLCRQPPVCLFIACRRNFPPLSFLFFPSFRSLFFLHLSFSRRKRERTNLCPCLQVVSASLSLCVIVHLNNSSVLSRIRPASFVSPGVCTLTPLFLSLSVLLPLPGKPFSFNSVRPLSVSHIPPSPLFFFPLLLSLVPSWPDLPLGEKERERKKETDIFS